ncbi:MAG: TetR/AcrR family transcriptional regulator [Deltaproteobacteria bacterium]|nr:MAG: TetR/AcrR family transcriptional regulator [Deltaproteobacteria bacterium]
MAVHSAANKRKGAPDKRDRILKAAIKVFAKNGFYSTRVSEIAKAAGVADGTIYLYFKNKEDVLITIFEEGITRLLTIRTSPSRAASPTSLSCSSACSRSSATSPR